MANETEKQPLKPAAAAVQPAAQALQSENLQKRIDVNDPTLTDAEAVTKALEG
jgi:hypothetical protein